ncbi:hypothetical protein D3C73_678850 [compost metagenome]
MTGTLCTFLEQAEQRDFVFALHRQCLGMPVGNGLGDDLEVDAADRRLDVREVAFEHRIAGIEEIRLEEFAGDIAFGGAETDLAHGLHQ